MKERRGERQTCFVLECWDLVYKPYNGGVTILRYYQLFMGSTWDVRVKSQ